MNSLSIIEDVDDVASGMVVMVKVAYVMGSMAKVMEVMEIVIEEATMVEV